jgi:hypothetical protein
MRRQQRWMVMALVATGLAVSGCAETSSESEDSGDPAAELVAIEGSDLQQVVLTEKAVERLDIQMVGATGGPTGQVVPYASLVYDAEGDTWVYTSPEPLTFVRSPVTVATIAGESAYLTAGPGVGTEVVTVGTAELFGTEQEIGQ